MIHVSPFGDRAVEVALATDDAREAHAIARILERAAIEGVAELVVGYGATLAHLDEGVDPIRIAPLIERAIERAVGIAGLDIVDEAARDHVVRAVYDGPDLAFVADACGLTIDDVVERHAARTYRVDVIGFLPGFAYLGGLDPSLSLPRRETPRARVPELSLAIAGGRTAIYPRASPGGWHLLGRVVDCAPFDVGRARPSLFSVGDRVRFEIVR